MSEGSWCDWTDLGCSRSAADDGYGPTLARCRGNCERFSCLSYHELLFLDISERFRRGSYPEPLLLPGKKKEGRGGGGEREPSIKEFQVTANQTHGCNIPVSSPPPPSARPLPSSSVPSPVASGSLAVPPFTSSPLYPYRYSICVCGNVFEPVASVVPHFRFVSS